MLSKEHRFHKAAALRFVFKRGKVVRGQYFVLRYAVNPRAEHFRVAVIVSRKVHKSAVKRNRIRRRIYESIGHQSALFAQPVDIIITVHSNELAEMPFEKLNHHVLKQLSAAQLIA